MLYTGVTNDLEHRVFQHKTKEVDGFTKKYNIHRLVYFEAFGEIREAIAREKQIKGWLRAKKSGTHRISESGVAGLSAGMDEEKSTPWVGCHPERSEGSQRRESKSSISEALGKTQGLRCFAALSMTRVWGGCAEFGRLPRGLRFVARVC